MNSPRKLYDLVEAPQFTAQRNALNGDVARMDTILQAITFELARDPEYHPVIEGTRVRITKSVSFFSDVPPLRIFYVFEPERERVVLHGIEIAP